MVVHDQARPLPSADEVRGYTTVHSNWGRWENSRLGTLNLITPEVRQRAVRAVRLGRTVTLSRPLDSRPGRGNPYPLQHYVALTPAMAADYIGIFFHGWATTHIDGFAHAARNGEMFDGLPFSDVTAFGARSNSHTIDHWAEGILTRGVLLDIPRLRGMPHVTMDRPVRGWELEAAAEQQGITVEPGDAVLVYSGRESFYRENPERSLADRETPGLHADVIPFMHKHDASVLLWDMMDAHPSGYDEGIAGTVHPLALVYLGLPLVDNSLLEPLAAVCAEVSQWDFLLTLNPLRLRGGTGSPVNPVAVL